MPRSPIPAKPAHSAPTRSGTRWWRSAFPQLADRLNEEAHWNRMLSLGEQQRLGLARALLHAPDYLFLDEATASLDEPSEAALYRLLLEKLPATTIVSIGHRSTLEAFHDRKLDAGARRRPLRAERSRRKRKAGLTTARALQPALRPDLAADPAMPDQAKRGQQQCAGQHRREQERPGQVVGNHQQRIDPGRRMKGAGQIHRQHREADAGRRRQAPGRSACSTASPTRVETR